MSQPAAPLDYADPRLRPQRPRRFGLLIAAVALVVGCGTANRFADAAGFPAVPSGPYADPAGCIVLRAMCGVAMAAFAAVVTAYLIRLAEKLPAALAGAGDRRPGDRVAITLIIVGAACVLGSLAIPFYFAHVSYPAISLTTQGPPTFSINAQTPLLGEFLTVLTFGGGATLVGIGVWASMRRAPTPTAAPPPPPPPTQAAAPVSPPHAAAA